MDQVSKETRSRIMRAVRSKDTKLERKFRSALCSEGIGNIKLNPDDLLGKPDFVHIKAKVAIFLDSCFWHGCPNHVRMPMTNSEYWQKKIEGNKERDRLVTVALRKDGWQVVRIWEHSMCDEASLRIQSKKVSDLIRTRTSQS